MVDDKHETSRDLNTTMDEGKDDGKDDGRDDVRYHVQLVTDPRRLELGKEPGL